MAIAGVIVWPAIRYSIFRKCSIPWDLAVEAEALRGSDAAAAPNSTLDRLFCPCPVDSDPASDLMLKFRECTAFSSSQI
jgi:hypothetical protein